MKDYLFQLFILVLIISPKVETRYRAYKYKITDVANDNEHEITSTLAPQTFINYYESTRSFRKIEVMSTWMCWGNTSYFKEICKDPRED